MVKSWTAKVTVTEWDRALLVPVTETCLVPAVEKLQDSVELPDPVMLVGETPHEAVVLVARATTAAKPFCPAKVIVEAPAALTFVVTLVGLAAIVKSWTI